MRIDRSAMAAAMAERDLNVQALSALTGVSRSTISAIKSGKRCSPDTTAKLVAILGTAILEKTKYSEI